MQKKFLFLFYTGFIFMVTSCGPQYKTEYMFSAPPTSKGKSCSQDCLRELPVCKNTCELKRASCIEQQEIKATHAYFEYLKEQKNSKEIATKDESDFLNTSMCKFYGCEGDCETQHRICHVNCGGDVKTHRYCSSNCESE